MPTTIRGRVLEVTDPPDYTVLGDAIRGALRAETRRQRASRETRNTGVT